MKKLHDMLIFGDSLAYNRYGYDEAHRPTAADCYPDMRAWSFRLRDHVMASSAGFLFGADLKQPHMTLPHTVYGTRAFTGYKEEQFCLPGKTASVTLYLQRHIPGGRYEVEVDGGFSREEVDFSGVPNVYHGGEVFTCTLPADPERAAHDIVFRGSGIYTVLGIAAWRHDNVHMNRLGNSLLFEAVRAALCAD